VTLTTEVIADSWLVEMLWDETSVGGPTQLIIKPADPTNPPNSGLSQVVLRDITFTAKKPVMKANKEEVALLRQLSKDRAITKEYLSILSKVYVGLDSKPLFHLVELTGKSYPAIRNHLWQATKKGLLKRSPGRAGGVISDEAARIVRREVHNDYE
jgi:hypothetical protein